MAIVKETSSYNGSDSTLSVAVAKPTGLAVGDLLLAVAHWNGNNAFTPPANFTQLQTGIVGAGGTNNKLWVGYRIATSADTSATDYTFTLGNSHSLYAGLIRFSGVDTTTPIYASSKVDEYYGGTGNFLPTITPLANSMLIMFAIADGTQNASNEAIATSNPSWTELWDRNGFYSDFLAYSTVRSASTATGWGSATFSASNGVAGVLLSISPYVAPTGPTNLKSLDTNLKANIKSIDTNLIANVKSYDTVV